MFVNFNISYYRKKTTLWVPYFKISKKKLGFDNAFGENVLKFGTLVKHTFCSNGGHVGRHSSPLVGVVRPLNRLSSVWQGIFRQRGIFGGAD